MLINISDHHTRTKVNAAFSFPSIHEEEEEEAGVRDAIPRVMGCLLGQQRGLTVDVSNSFEVNASSENPNLMDLVFLQKKVDQCEFSSAKRKSDDDSRRRAFEQEKGH